MAEGWRMWAISILTIMLLTLLSAAPIDNTDDIKKEDVKADVEDDNDAMHSHDENVTRGGKFFGHNQFDLGNINVPGSVAGDDVSIGHEVNIDVQGHTHDHHHHEDDTVIKCKEGLREMFKSIDSNKDGLMDAKELLRVCHKNNIQITESIAVRILTLPDKTVGFNIAKFCELLKDCPSTYSADSIYFLLQLFDKAVDGGWSNWSEYGQCTKSCGGGRQTRTRTCTNPVPQHNGRTCEQQNIGHPTQTRDCNLHDCAVDGGWSNWSEYGQCSKSCGGGRQTRTRTCTNPVPQRKGRTCEQQNIGDPTETKDCNLHDCASCMVHVGTSRTNTISATVLESCVCPSAVKKGHWLDDTHPEEFKVMQDGSSLQVQRTDSNTGWEMDLSFECVKVCEVKGEVLTEDCFCETQLCKQGQICREVGCSNSHDNFEFFPG